MPDLSMCSNLKCPGQETCYRFRATPGYWQSYSSYEPDESGKCRSYISVEGYPEASLVKIKKPKKETVVEVP